ncbi:MAG: hypothetical protein CL928_01040 [Deltaproteobacteria bacterium]|nr:hypothetical protein [Deltaproteobacteria bacterium]
MSVRFPCTIKPLIDGAWQARCMASAIGTVVVEADSREEALDQMRDEIRFRVEFCPCSAVADDYVQLDVTEQFDRRHSLNGAPS